MRLTEKVAIITGAALGIGRASALLFSREGASVVVADWNDEEGMKTVEVIQNQGGKAHFVHADVTKNQKSRIWLWRLLKRLEN